MDEKTKQVFEDLNWARQNHSQLLHQYRGEWIGIYKREVLGTLRELEKLEKRGKLPTDKKNIAKYFVYPPDVFYPTI